MKTELKEIKLGKIILREIEENDYLALYECGKNKLMCETLNWGPFNSLIEAKYVINEIYLKRPIWGLPIGYGVIYDDKLIGVCDYHSYDSLNNSIEIGYFLNPDYWNMGIMTKVVKKAIEVAFDYLECDKVIIGSDIYNERSLKLINKLNLKYEYELINNYKDKDHLCKYYSIYKYEYKAYR